METIPDWLSESQHVRELVVSRLHYTYTVKDFFTFREDYRYVYSQVDGLRRLPLLWREREIQANMVTLDEENRNLIYLPSRELKSLAEALLLDLWEDFLLVVPEDVHAELNSTYVALTELAGFEPAGERVEEAVKALKGLRNRFGQTTALDGLTAFAELLVSYYIPFVQLGEVSKPEFVFVRYGVDVFRPFVARTRKPTRVTWRKEYSLRELLLFLMFGRIHFDLPLPLIAFQSPPWARTESLHLKINLPSGLEIRGLPQGLPRELFEKTKVIQFATHDEDNLYTYLSELDARRILERRQSILDDFSDAVSRVREGLKPFARAKTGDLKSSVRNLIREIVALRPKVKRAVQAHRPRIRIRSGLGPWMKVVLLLLWVVVGIEYICEFLRILDLNSFLQLFGALLVVILTVAVYSVEKPYVRLPISAHVLSSTIVFFELPLLAAAKTMLTL